MRTCAVIALFLMLAACQQATVQPEAKDEPIKQYPMHGEILSLDTQDKTAHIKAGKIDGWMEAMTMEYPIKDQAEFNKLHTGENINATVFVQGNSYWVGGIQEDTAPASSPAPASK